MDYARSQSGLILARETTDGAALERALKRLDRDLTLQAWPQPAGPPIWKVVRYAGPDRPPEPIYSHIDRYGDPLPLTWGLIDEVQQLDKNARVRRLDADAKNAAFKEQLEKDWERDAEAIADDWAFKHGRPVLHRSQALRRSRDRRRAGGEKV